MARPFAGTVLGFALLLASAARAADATDRFSRTIPLPGDRALRLEATIAEVTIIGSSRPDVEIEIVRRAPAAIDFDKFPVIVDETTTGLVRIAATQIAEGRDARLKAEIVVRAPAAARLQAVRVFEGRVRVSGLTESCDVDLQRGPIDAEGIAGRIRLETGIGRIDVKDAALTPGGMMRLRVFNGPLHVRLARAPANARILALTFNGTITSDIPLAMKDQFGPRFGEATIGTGEPVMSLDVVTGDITIAVGRK